MNNFNMAAGYMKVSNDALWRDCALWLTRWGMLREDHKANLPEGTIADLANLLRDGVLLCKLLHKIDHRCVDLKDVSLKPSTAQFLCLRNISLFKYVCQQYFDIKETDLFEEDMLFELTHFHKVLCTLAILSQSQKVLRVGIKGFSAEVERTEEEDEIYQQLKKVPPTNTSFDSNCSAIDCLVNSYSLDSDDIYDDLLAVRSEVQKRTLPRTKRECVIHELLETEENYVGLLNKLNRALRALWLQMKPWDHEVVFTNIKELYEIHSPFMIELGKTRRSTKIKLSQVFLKFKDEFLIYGNYGSNLMKATTRLQELCDQDKDFNDVVLGFEKDEDNGKFKLKDLLVVPMQRVLKYHLLLDALIKATEETHKEYASLCKAKDAMLDVSEAINEIVRDAEHLSVINNIQELIVDCVFDAETSLLNYGRLIKDAEIKMTDSTNRKAKKKDRYIFIFDKCILVCEKAKGHRFAYRDVLNIMEYRVIKIDSRDFLLVHHDGDTAYTFSVCKATLKQQIIEAINQAIDNVQPKALSHTKHKFKINTFSKPVRCEVCSKYLKGLIFQGYLCSKCKVPVHKGCIQSSGKCKASGAPTLPKPQIPKSIGGRNPLRDKLWFVGEMNRETAERILFTREKGTFMVRIGKDSCYVITLRTGDSTPFKHMRISQKHGESGGPKKYCLSGSRLFNSMDELILTYENYSLRENFDGLEEDTKLLYPFNQLRARVVRNFDARDRYQLSVREGQVLTVIGKEGYNKDFWKGRTEDNQTGYLPISVILLEGEMRFS